MDESHETEQRPRQSSLGVLGLGLGLLLVVGSALGLAYLRRPIERLDPEELLAERFAGVAELPFGFRPVGAERDSRDRVILRFDGARAGEAGALEVDAELGAPGGEPEARAGGSSSGAEGAGPDAGPDAGPGPRGRIDWEALTVSAADRPPARGALVWYRRDRADEVLRDLFTSLRFESGKRGGRGDERGGRRGGEAEAPEPKLQDAGTIEWAGYSAPYVRLREFELVDGRPTFHESVRVNLTVGPWCCVLFLRWPDGEAGSRARTLELLRVFEPQTTATSTP